ncbi:MAG: hypothetical protein NTW87_05485 [Planctomycetota bacterium]|nr:hypothetical protein [Planctomycetota bacterium]
MDKQRNEKTENAERWLAMACQFAQPPRRRLDDDARQWLRMSCRALRPERGRPSLPA